MEIRKEDFKKFQLKLITLMRQFKEVERKKLGESLLTYCDEKLETNNLKAILSILSEKNLFNCKNHLFLRDLLKKIGREKIYDLALSVCNVKEEGGELRWELK